MGARRSWILLPLPMLMLSLSAQAQESGPARALAGDSKRPLLSEPESRDAEQADVWQPDVETRAWRGLYLNKSGLEIRQPLQLGERRFELGLKGPLMKRKRVGLKLELRF